MVATGRLGAFVGAFLGAVVLASCAGDRQPAAPRPPPGEPVPLSSLDEVCDGALSARDVLAGAPAEVSALLTYHDRPGTTPLRVRVTYADGALTCWPRQAAASPRGPESEPMVLIDVVVELVTDDGALDEWFVASLGGGRGTAVSWESPSFRSGELCGTWDPALPGYENVDFGFHGGFDGPATWGELIKHGQEPGHVPSSWLAATWRN